MKEERLQPERIRLGWIDSQDSLALEKMFADGWTAGVVRGIGGRKG